MNQSLTLREYHPSARTLRAAGAAIVLPLIFLGPGAPAPARAEPDAALVAWGDPAPIPPTEEGGYGVLWVPGDDGLPTPEIRVVSPRMAAAQWLDVHIVGLGVDYHIRQGPFEADGAIFTLPLVLDARAQAPGLVQVTVRLDIEDPDTGEPIESRTGGASYVTEAATPRERWLDEASARDLAVATLPVALPEGTEFDLTVGLEVSR